MIKPSEFEYEGSRLEDLYVFLDSKGYNVYFPVQHVGDCLEPYVVVKYNGTSGGMSFSSREDLYSILFYVPSNQYSKMEQFVQSVKQDMKEIEPLFMVYNDQQLPAYFDEANKGHYVEIDYKNYKFN